MDQGSTGGSHGSLEALQLRSNSLQRARPPDLTITGDGNRVPLRPESRTSKASRRDSRMGLRSIFNKSRAVKDNDEHDNDIKSSSRETPRPGSVRMSLADLRTWPYGLSSPQSNIPVTTSPPAESARSPSFLAARKSDGRDKALPISPGSDSHLGRRANGAWRPPPLFQVYPQAIRHAVLPACSASVEALARLNKGRNSLLLSDEIIYELANQDEKGEKKSDRGKKQQRAGQLKGTLEWTTKVYALVTSGYLLQYAGEGQFDRPPERIIQLTKQSAAFASDLIPGRHWVLQVVSCMDAVGTAGPETRSLFSKLSLRGLEKKQASTCLMVFESAEDMESWLAVIRREIEILGGQRQLSETGIPKDEETAPRLLSRPSQRTLVARDPSRYSSIVQRDFSWTNQYALEESRVVDILPASVSPELALELSLDDISTTESHYSSDGQHLDSLRDSNHRLSCISSGQRTFVTSANSSPASSPTRTSFPNLDELKSQSPDMTSRQFYDHQPEIRPRPNAQAIASRRQSMQTMVTGFDSRNDSATRPHSTISTITEMYETNPRASSRQSVPNFSKRFPNMKATPTSMSPESSPQTDQSPVSRPARRTPPTALAMSRPLSIVLDQPSPLSPSPSATPMDSVLSAQPQGEMSMRYSASISPAVQCEKPTSFDRPERSNPRDKARAPAQDASATVRSHVGAQPRYFSSMSNLRSWSSQLVSASEGPHIALSRGKEPSSARSRRMSQQPLRSVSSLSTHAEERKPATSPSAKPLSDHRASFLAEGSPLRPTRHSFASLHDQTHNENALPPPPPEKSSKRLSRSPLTSSPNQYLNMDLRAKGLQGRRSMPQLADGPPPAPPPTRALPAIPKGY